MTQRLCVRARAHTDARANVTIEVHDAVTGALLSRERQHNLVVSAGRNLIRDLLNGTSSAALTHFALGSGSTAVAATDVALQTEVFRDALTQKTPDAAKLTCKYYLATGSANGHTLREAGLLTAAALGTLYARVALASPVVKTSSIAVTFTWELTWSV